MRKRDTARRRGGARRAADGDDRLAEIARLMSGRVTDAALARAIELRGEAVDTIASRSGARTRRAAPVPPGPDGSSGRRSVPC